MAFAISGNAMDNADAVDYTMPDMTLVNQIEADNTRVYDLGITITIVVEAEFEYVDSSGTRWRVRVRVEVEISFGIMRSFDSEVVDQNGNQYNYKGNRVPQGGNVIGNTGEYDATVIDQTGHPVPLYTIPAVELVQEFEQIAANAQT